MRYEVVKKRLWKESLIVGGALAVLGGGAYYLSMTYDENERDNKTLETQVNSIVAEMNTLRDQFTTVQANADLYQEALRKSNNDGLSLNRELVKSKFDQFKTRYYLSTMRLTMEPPKELTGSEYKRNTVQMIASNIKTGFYALTDEDIYGLLPAIQKEFSGSVKFTRVNLVRKTPPTEENLSNIRRTGQAQLVEAAIEFVWFGIKQGDTTPPGGPPGVPGLPPGMLPIPGAAP